MSLEGLRVFRKEEYAATHELGDGLIPFIVDYCVHDPAPQLPAEGELVIVKMAMWWLEGEEATLVGRVVASLPLFDEEGLTTGEQLVRVSLTAV